MSPGSLIGETMDRVATEGAGLTRAERIAKGKAARAAVPHARHAEFARHPDRPDPLALLASQDAARLQELLPLRYGRMALSPFSYFRGTALPMASDLAGTARTGFLAQACGDAHLLNFGLFASPERRLVFDISDFDETLPGPWEWDVKRLAASLEIVARNNGYAVKQRRNVVVGSIAEYRRAMREFAGWSALEVWYAHADVEALREEYAGTLSPARRKRLADRVAKAHTNDNLGALRKFTEIVDGNLRIRPDAPLIVPVEQLAGYGQDSAELTARLTAVLNAYRETLEPERRRLLDRYRLVDLARKVVGVGSVGTRCWMALLLGTDERDPLFLQVKEAGPSVLEAFLGRSRYHNAGRRVVVGQRLMQTVSDIFLGWVRATDFDGRTRDFHIRQLRDGKGSADVEAMTPGVMFVYGRLCAWTLARAHARTGDAIAIAAYLGAGSSFEEAIRAFASAYADQNERDHAALLDAIKAGRIAAGHGPPRGPS